MLTDALSNNPLLAIAMLFGAGVLTSTFPCIYPMIPITAAILGGTAGESRSRWRTVGLTLTYVGGLALFYALLGLLAGLSGQIFGAVSSNRWVLLAVGIVLLVFGLVMLDVIPVAMPVRLVQWAGGLGGRSYPAVFLLGATSGIVAAPCGAPAFGVVLTWVASTRSAALGFIYLFVFSLGMSAVLVAVGLSSGVLARLPRSGKWMVWLKKGSGVVLLGVAVYYFILTGQTM